MPKLSSILTHRLLTRDKIQRSLLSKNGGTRRDSWESVWKWIITLLMTRVACKESDKISLSRMIDVHITISSSTLKMIWKSNWAHGIKTLLKAVLIDLDSRLLSSMNSMSFAWSSESTFKKNLWRQTWKICSIRRLMSHTKITSYPKKTTLTTILQSSNLRRQHLPKLVRFGLLINSRSLRERKLVSIKILTLDL